MKAIKSEKWYNTQIALRERAIDNLYRIHNFRNEVATSEEAIRANQTAKRLAAELTELRRDLLLYYRG